jgi:hypothetical protein
MRKTKLVLNVVLLVLAFSYLGFIIADRNGVWDRLFGIDLDERAATNFESLNRLTLLKPAHPCEWVTASGGRFLS